MVGSGMYAHTPETFAVVGACVHAAVAVAHGGALHGVPAVGKLKM